MCMCVFVCAALLEHFFFSLWFVCFHFKTRIFGLLSHEKKHREKFFFLSVETDQDSYSIDISTWVRKGESNSCSLHLTLRLSFVHLNQHTNHMMRLRWNVSIQNHLDKTITTYILHGVFHSNWMSWIQHTYTYASLDNNYFLLFSISRFNSMRTDQTYIRILK